MILGNWDLGTGIWELGIGNRCFCLTAQFEGNRGIVRLKFAGNREKYCFKFAGR